MMCLVEHKLREKHIRDRVKEYKRIVELPNAPSCSCGTVADGESGNVKLDTTASYSSFKHSCFPGLRTFLFSGGPRHLTKVVRRPMWKGQPIPEVDRHGKFIYN